MNNRIIKAIRYINNHKAKKCIIESKPVISKDLERTTGSMSINGSTGTFMTAICNRFRSGFFLSEYIEILNGLIPDYTDKQIKYHNWV